VRSLTYNEFYRALLGCPIKNYKIVKHYAAQTGLLSEIPNIGAHAMRATATNALEHAADITKVQELQRQAFERLEDVPPEIEWFANLQNKNTKRAYLKDVQQFQQFSGITALEDFRDVTRAHVIAFRDYLKRQELSAATIRRKLAALSALFSHLCNSNSVLNNPCAGVARPTEGANEGKTPALSSAQAKKLLTAPPEDTLKGVRDRAILAILLYHGLRREELCKLKIKDLEHRQGIPHFCVHGKRDKIRYVPIHPAAIRLVDAYRAMDCLIEESNTPLFRPVKNNTSKTLIKHLSPDAMFGVKVVCPN